MRRLAATAAVALALAACGATTTTSRGPLPTDVAATSTSTTAAAPSTTASRAPTTSRAPTPETTEGPEPSCCDEVPQVVVAGRDGIAVTGGTAVVGPADGGAWVTAIPDGAGGLVYAGVGQDVAQIVWWWPAGALDPVLVSFKPGRILWDAAVIDGAPTAIVVDDPDPSPDSEPEAVLQLLPLFGGDPIDVADLTPGAVAQVSYAAGRFLVAENVEGCAVLRAFDATGGPVDMGLPDQECEAAVTGAALAPGGERLAYALVESGAAGAPTAAAVVLVGPGGEPATRRLGLEPDTMTGAVDYDGRWVLVEGAFDEAAGGRPALVADTASGEPLPAPLGPIGNGFRFLAGPPEIEAE